MLAERLWSSSDAEGAWNFGPVPEDTRPVGWVVGRMIDLWGAPVEWNAAQGRNPHEAAALTLDSSKARLRLAWVPRWGLDVGLVKTVEWYRTYQPDSDMQEYSMAQIGDYQGDVR